MEQRNRKAECDGLQWSGLFYEGALTLQSRLCAFAGA